VAGPRVELVGADTFDRTLDQAADAISDMKGATEKTATLIVADARARAPRRTGRLASSITGDVQPNQSLVGSDLVYAPVIHWGWPDRNIAPQPFLLEAAEGTETQWVGYFEDDITKAISKVRGA
jgi:phage gpG-like protein